MPQRKDHPRFVLDGQQIAPGKLRSIKDSTG